MNLEVNGSVHSDGCVTAVPDDGVYTVAMAWLNSEAICPQAAVMLNSLKHHYVPVPLHSASNKPKLPGIKSNSTMCRVLALAAREQILVPGG